MFCKKISINLAILFVFFFYLAAADIAAAQQPPPRPFWDLGIKPPRPNDPNRPPRPGAPGGPPPARSHSDFSETTLNTAGSTPITAEVWVDNWFKLYVNGRELIEDSVPLQTERSFNVERFSFRADKPITFAFEFRDYMQNATGLEYIGTRRQQIGDGGAIGQFKDSQTGALIAVTNSQWRCLVVQHAPVEQACAQTRNPTVDKGVCAQRIRPIPQNWASSNFDDSSWPRATEYPARAVRPKDGYDRINWLQSAKFIWGPDLKRDNVLLCRFTVR